MLGDLRERLGCRTRGTRVCGAAAAARARHLELHLLLPPQLARATDAWTVPLVVRILLVASSGPTLVREDAIQRFVAAHGYPALVPFALEATGDGALGLPFMVVPRIMGGTMLEAVGRNPLAVPRLLRAMADAHVALHRIPIDRCPLPYDAPLVERRIEDWHQRLRFEGADESRRGLAWLEERAGLVRQEELAILSQRLPPDEHSLGRGGPADHHRLE